MATERRPSFALGRLLVAAAGLLVMAAGCRRAEITSLQRKEGAQAASEAQFALTMHDYVRAEAELAKAVAICPDTGDYWLTLGSARVRLGQRHDHRSGKRFFLFDQRSGSGPRRSTHQVSVAVAYFN